MIVALDIGGTKILSALITSENKIKDEKRITTPRGNVDDFIRSISQAIGSLWNNKESSIENILGVGLSIAGTVDYHKGYLFRAPNIDLSDVRIIEILHERFDFPIYMDNDANLACLGEYLYGAGQGVKNVICLTLGTGIGGGIIIDGQLYRGTCGGAGELGHSIIEVGGPQCSCQRLGCYEEIASGRALGRLAAEMASTVDKSMVNEVLRGEKKITGEMISQAVDQDKAFAVEVMDKYANLVAEGVINYVNIFNPDKVVLGGGVMDDGEEILKVVREKVKVDALPPNNECVEVVKAKLGNRAGLLGAAGMVRLALGGEDN